MVLVNLLWALFLIVIFLGVALTISPNLLADSKPLLAQYFPNLFALYGGLMIYSVIALFLVVVAFIIVWIARKILARKAIGAPSGSRPTAKTKAVAGDKEVGNVLKTMDDLLAKLPEEEIEKFMKSKNAKAYRKVLDKYNIE